MRVYCIGDAVGELTCLKSKAQNNPKSVEPDPAGVMNDSSHFGLM